MLLSIFHASGPMPGQVPVMIVKLRFYFRRIYSGHPELEACKQALRITAGDNSHHVGFLGFLVRPPANGIETAASEPQFNLAWYIRGKVVPVEPFRDLVWLYA